MLRIRRVSGEELCALDLTSFHATLPGNTIRALKQHLHRKCGLPRFRQRLVYLGDDSALADDCILRAGEVQVLLLNFCPAATAQVTALWFAAKHGHTSTVENLLQRPTDPDSACVGRPTPLWVACGRGHLEVARLLLEANADKDKAEQNGSTPLYIAAENGQLEAARLLLEAKADKDKAVEDGTTPLHMAAQNGQLEVARLLLEANADKDKAKQSGHHSFVPRSSYWTVGGCTAFA